MSDIDKSHWRIAEYVEKDGKAYTRPINEGNVSEWYPVQIEESKLDSKGKKLSTRKIMMESCVIDGQIYLQGNEDNESDVDFGPITINFE